LAYQSEELIDFWWRCSPGYGFHHFSTFFIIAEYEILDSLASVSGRFTRHSAKWLTPTR